MNTATSFATKDTNMRLLFCARWTVLLQHLTAAHCVCVWIVCVSFRAPAHSRVPRRLSADGNKLGAGFRAPCPVVLTCFSAWQVGGFTWVVPQRLPGLLSRRHETTGAPGVTLGLRDRVCNHCHARPWLGSTVLMACRAPSGSRSMRRSHPHSHGAQHTCGLHAEQLPAPRCHAQVRRLLHARRCSLPCGADLCSVCE
jgi:hypothetical protein